MTRSSSAVVARLAALALLLSGATGCGTEDTSHHGPVTNPQGYSRLDEPGTAHIEKSREARFDLSDHTVTRADVGLGDDDLGPVVGSARGPAIRLDLTAPKRREDVRTSTFSLAFNHTGGDASYLTWFEHYDTADGAQAALQRAIGHYGFRREDVTNTMAYLAGSSPSTTPASTIGPAVTPTGLVVDVTVRPTSDGGRTLQYDVQLDARYYTAGALEHIRATGRAPVLR